MMLMQDYLNKQNKDKNNRFLFENYTLIGMSGSGKSTLAAALALKISYQFVDTDILVVKHCKKPLQVIVNRYKKNFNNYIGLERRVFCNQKFTQSIIATGGSLCYSPQVIRRNPGVVIYLQVNWHTLVRRVGDFQGRGLVLLSKNQRTEFQKRIPMYEKMADFKINCNGLNIAEILRAILCLPAKP